MAIYDLEERALSFAILVRSFVRRLPKTIANIEDIKQLVRSSASVGANYIEANESLGKKDKIMKIKISLREAKESRFFIRLIHTGNDIDLEKDKLLIDQEAHELMNIFGAILKKLE